MVLISLSASHFSSAACRDDAMSVSPFTFPRSPQLVQYTIRSSSLPRYPKRTLVQALTFTLLPLISPFSDLSQVLTLLRTCLPPLSLLARRVGDARLYQ